VGEVLPPARGRGVPGVIAGVVPFELTLGVARQVAEDA
jgi:hypothetical protein